MKSQRDDEFLESRVDDLVEEMETSLQLRSQKGRFQTFAALASSSLAWYDFQVYGYFADALKEVFFSHDEGASESNALTTLAIFGGSFLMRPIGGIVLGWIADKYGRKKALEISVFLMGLSTLLMACLPTYDMIGKFASISLIFVRMMQGFSLGGHYMISLTFIMENESREKWGLNGSLVNIAPAVGALVGGYISAQLRGLLSKEQLLTWGWRVAFLPGASIGVVGVYLRQHCTEVLQHQPPNNPLTAAFAKDNPRRLMAAFLVNLTNSAGLYLTFIWIPILLRNAAKTLRPAIVTEGFWINFWALLHFCFLAPYAGSVSDKRGRESVLIIGLFSFALLSPLAIYLLGIGDSVVDFCAVYGMATALSIFIGPCMAWLAELFPRENRVMSLALADNLAAALVGITTRALATSVTLDVSLAVPGYFLALVAFLSLVGVLCVSPKPPGSNMITIKIE